MPISGYLSAFQTPKGGGEPKHTHLEILPPLQKMSIVWHQFRVSFHDGSERSLLQPWSTRSTSGRWGLNPRSYKNTNANLEMFPYLRNKWFFNGRIVVGTTLSTFISTVNRGSGLNLQSHSQESKQATFLSHFIRHRWCQPVLSCWQKENRCRIIIKTIFKQFFLGGEVKIDFSTVK